MPKSQKPIIIEHLFFDRYDASSGMLSDPIVTSAQLAQAKQYCMDHKGTTLSSDKNNFNFMKDIVRSKTASKIWPDSHRSVQPADRYFSGDHSIQLAKSPSNKDSQLRPNRNRRTLCGAGQKGRSLHFPGSGERWQR